MKSFILFSFVVLSLLTLNIRPIICGDFSQQYVSKLKLNGYVMLNGRPCQIYELTDADDGSIDIKGIDIFTSEMYSGNFLPRDVVDVPIVTRETYVLLRIDEDGTVLAMSETTDEEDTFEMPAGDLGDQIRTAIQQSPGDISLSVMSAVGKRAIVSFLERGAPGTT